MNQEQYTEFEDNVLQAAQAQVRELLDKAHAQGKQEYDAILKSQSTDSVKTYQEKAQREYQHKMAALRQEMRRKLLVYRGQLTNGLFAEVEENIVLFTQGAQYGGYLQKCLRKYPQFATQPCTVLLRTQDATKFEQQIKSVLPNAQLKPDDSIRLGGLKIISGRFLFDETLDSAAQKERKDFLGRCNLRIE